jgi:hypothetical protein
MPKLKKIDLNKADEHNHPDIKMRVWYLAKIDGSWYTGKFSRQWYGLNFDTDSFAFGAGIQFDEPGTNCSDWEELYELVTRKPAKKKKVVRV